MSKLGPLLTIRRGLQNELHRRLLGAEHCGFPPGIYQWPHHDHPVCCTKTDFFCVSMQRVPHTTIGWHGELRTRQGS